MDIVIREQKVDWLKIIDLVFKRHDWGKTHTIYTSGSTTINCVLREFNFEECTAWFNLKVEYVDEKRINTFRTERIRYVINHFSIDDFKMHLNKRLISLLKEIMEKETRAKAETPYLNLEHKTWRLKPKDYVDAGLDVNYDKIMELDNDIQKDCLDALNDEVVKVLNEEFENKVEIYMKVHPFKNESIIKLINRLED